MSTIVIWILAFLLAISVLVAVHEFGHYWVARRLGIKVLRFSIGFGKPIWRWVGGRDRTEYVVSSLPLGGYVKMLDERDCTVAPEERHRTFNNAPIAARLAVLAAGPFFNFLFASLIYWFVFMTGDDSQLRPVIGEIAPDSYASAAGLRAGDEILSVGDEPVITWQDATLAIIDDLVDDGRIGIVVRDERGSERRASLDVGEDKKRLTEPGELLGGLGIAVRPSTIPARLGAGRIEGLDGFEVAQINYSTVEPGVIKAFHLHLRQTDIWYVPPEDRVLLVLVDQRQDSATRGQRMRLVLGDGNSRLVRVPPGVAHGCRNISGRTARILYLTDVHFSSDPEQCDEGRLPWDMFGAELWDVARE